MKPAPVAEALLSGAAGISAHLDHQNLSANQHLAPADIVIHGKNGRESTVSGIRSKPGEALPQMIRRLYPDLPDDQVAAEVRQVLKYNKDYGNDLGDGGRLKPNQTIYLTSVEYKDQDGRPTKIVSPTGRTTEIAYDVSGVASYKIQDPGAGPGDYFQTVTKNAAGQWVETDAGGKQKALSDVAVDAAGDVITTNAQGERMAHLTCGDDIYTDFTDNKPTSSYAMREGRKLATYSFDNDRATVTYEDSHQTMALENSGPNDSDRGDPVAVDISPDSYVSNVLGAARSLLGHNGSEWNVDPGVSCALFDSLALKAAGFSWASDKLTNCDDLANDLQSNGFVKVPVSQMQPGDVIMATNNEHTAIYEGNGKILANSTKQRQFVQDDYSNVFVGYLGQSVTVWHYPSSKAKASN
jgi:hypothetical protein